MLRTSLLLLTTAATLAACSSPPPIQYGADGKPLPRLYQRSAGETGAIQYRMLDGVNALRSARGLAMLQLSPELNAAAATHSRDMAVQNRPWHFGSDGSSPVIRAQRAGYRGEVLGALISETYETELETLAAWMEDKPSRETLLDPAARLMGFDFFQDGRGKIWWTLLLGN